MRLRCFRFTEVALEPIQWLTLTLCESSSIYEELPITYGASTAMYSKLAHEHCTLRDISYAASIGCQYLNNLKSDPDFKVFMKILFDRRKANHRAFDEIMLAKINFRNFHHFLEQEKIVLREGGFNTELIEEIIQKADQLIQNKRLRDTNGEILLREIDIVRDDACKLASRLKRAEKYEFSLKPVSNNHTIQQAKRAFYVIVGGAIIVLNALNASHRLSLAETAVSGALGSAFISQAIPTP